MRTKKMILAAFIGVLTIAMLLTGCGNKSGESSTGSDSSKSVKLSFWTGYSELDPWVKKAAEDFKKTNPNVTIEVTSYPLRDFEKKLAASLPSKSAADIVTMNHSLSYRYIDANLLQQAPDNVGQFAHSGAFPDLYVKNLGPDGKTYGLPVFKNANAIFYNKDMFNEAGLTEPPKSIDQFLEYAQKLAKSDASGNLVRSGQSLRISGGGSGVTEKFWILLAQRGGSIIKEVSPGKYKANYNTEEGYQTLKMYVDMLFKYHTDDAKIKHDTEAFQTGATAFFLRESNVVIDTAAKAPNLNYGTAPLAANVEQQDNFYVTTADKDKQEMAWKFLQFLMEPESQKNLMTMTGWLPVRKDLDLKDVFVKYPQFEAFFPAHQDAQMYPSLPEYDEIQTKLADRLMTKGYTDASFVDNPQKIKDFLDECAKETNEILKKSGDLAE
ncbi:extracellular solute-binding protein [Cohnella pontilimi]|uniref:Extracellular solute-binding protein n=1 Tax=Cohnella pontilimi TaxID=2564100 RepID=A0A4U0F8H4_9BACL|nr:extracellular solute-binding protein [Cohnella pontilimi]TJY40738.1 extracellular solute-binding protein [Cohnella pontilimi]